MCQYLTNGFDFISVCGAPSQCPEQYGEQAYAHPEICDQFFLCTNGTLTLETCENGLLFDGKGGVHNHCNYNWVCMIQIQTDQHFYNETVMI